MQPVKLMNHILTATVMQVHGVAANKNYTVKHPFKVS